MSMLFSQSIDYLISMKSEILLACYQTLIMLGISTIFSVLIGGIIGIILFISAENQLIENKIIHNTIGQIVNFIRAFPFIILMIVVSPLTRLIIDTSIGTYAATVILSIAGAFYFSRLVEQNLREVSKGVLEAADSMGARPITILFKVLISEARSGLVLSIAVLMITLLSASAAAGMIGGGGLGDLAIRYGYYRYKTEMMVSIVAILSFIVILIQITGNYLAKKLDKR